MEVHTTLARDNLFEVYRDDIVDNTGGGVLLAVSKRFISEEQPDLKTKMYWQHILGKNNATWY